MDDTTLVIARDAKYSTPELKVFFVQTFACTDDTSGTYSDFDITFEYKVETLDATIAGPNPLNISTMTSAEISKVLTVLGLVDSTAPVRIEEVNINEL